MSQQLLTLYHGSDKIIDFPTFGAGRPFNDYGLGFYCTQHIELAKEWACPSSLHSGFANEYLFDAHNLKFLHLTAPEYSTLHWLSLLLQNRNVDLRTPVAAQGYKFLSENYSIDTGRYDVIEGWRADDSYFSFARAFLQNQISLEQLTRCMRLGDLGTQVVIKSKKAFGRLSFKRAIEAPAPQYHPLRLSRDAKAREEFTQISNSFDLNGLYIKDIVTKRLTPLEVIEYERGL